MGCFNSKVSIDTKSIPNNNSFAQSSKSELSTGSSNKNSLRLDSGEKDVSLKTLTFRHVMNDHLGREDFMKFLKMEHAEENLSFFEV